MDYLRMKLDADRAWNKARQRRAAWLHLRNMGLTFACASAILLGLMWIAGRTVGGP